MQDDDRTVLRSSHAHQPDMAGVHQEQDSGVNALPVGTRLGEFEITGLIGEGGFGIVYLAHDSTLDRRVALKEFMPANMASRTRTMHVTVRSKRYVDTFKIGLRSFVNEARMLARFDSPSLVKVYRFWEENGTAYMVMPFYEGITLRQALRDRQVVPDERWLREMLASLLDAVDTIHAEQCYHRDIAPDNILVLGDGRPLLLDFGAARRVIEDVTQGLTVILKPGFAPIEQYAESSGMRQGPWTDIYAIAAVVYFMISGKAPPPSVARIMRDDMVPAVEAGRGRYTEKFLAVLDRALAIRPNDRIQNVAEFRSALGLEPIRGKPRVAAPSPHEEDWGRTEVRSIAPDSPSRKSGALLALSALAVCVGVAAVAGYRWMTAADPSPRSAAQVPSKQIASVAGAPAPEPALRPPPPQTAVAMAPSAPPAPSERPAPPPAAVPQPPSLAAEDELWRVATLRDQPAAYEAYLNRYPRGKHAAAARVMLSTKAPVAGVARPAVPQPAAVAPTLPTQVAGGSAGVANVPPAPKPPEPAEPVVNAEPEKREPARSDTAAASAFTPPPMGDKTLKLAGQSMTGNFASDPVTGLVTGSGRIVWDNGDRFEGRLVKGRKEGNGRFTWANGQRFTGDWVADVPNGRGVLEFHTGHRYEGEVKGGEPHGRGTVRYTSGDVYTGNWIQGKHHGRGRYTWANGTYWEGEFKDGVKTENGKTVYSDGRTVTGKESPSAAESAENEQKR